MSFKRNSGSSVVTMPIASFQYRHLTSGKAAPVATPSISNENPVRPAVEVSEEVLRQRLAAERAAGFAEAESTLRQNYEERSRREVENISAALRDFEQTRKTYFARVETELVKLSLAIAGKIIHREAQVDPMLIAAIVQLALGQLKEGSSATVRVRAHEASRFRAHFSTLTLDLKISVVEDDALEPGDCILETEMGVVNFSLQAQLKEVEQGFFDVLAQKPPA